jgi:hypothetical protein
VAGITLDVHTLLYAAMAVVIGFQAIWFAAFTKIFAISEGLLPEDKRLTRLFDFITLETGLVASGVMLLAGLGGSLYALSDWGARAFGPLSPAHTLRLVIPAVTALVLGAQLFFSSFFLSVMGLKRR